MARRRSGVLATVVATLSLVLGLWGAGVAQAAPGVDAVAALTKAGVPSDIAALARGAQPAAGAQTVNIAHPGAVFLAAASTR